MKKDYLNWIEKGILTGSFLTNPLSHPSRWEEGDFGDCEIPEVIPINKDYLILHFYTRFTNTWCLMEKLPAVPQWILIRVHYISAAGKEADLEVRKDIGRLYPLYLERLPMKWGRPADLPETWARKFGFDSPSDDGKIIEEEL